MDSAASYCPRDIACNPPLTTSAIYAAVKRMMATCALRILLKVTLRQEERENDSGHKEETDQGYAADQLDIKNTQSFDTRHLGSSPQRQDNPKGMRR